MRVKVVRQLQASPHHLASSLIQPRRPPPPLHHLCVQSEEERYSLFWWWHMEYKGHSVNFRDDVKHKEKKKQNRRSKSCPEELKELGGSPHPQLHPVEKQRSPQQQQQVSRARKEEPSLPLIASKYGFSLS